MQQTPYEPLLGLVQELAPVLGELDAGVERYHQRLGVRQAVRG